MTKLVLPEPETPVTQVNVPTGIWTVMSFKLCSFAPLITRNLPVPLRRSAETGVFIPAREILAGKRARTIVISARLPCATISPPVTPARAHIDDVVRRLDGLLIMFHNDHGVAGIPQLLEQHNEFARCLSGAVRYWARREYKGPPPSSIRAV